MARNDSERYERTDAEKREPPQAHRAGTALAREIPLPTL